MKIYVFCHIGAKRPNGGVKILFEYAKALMDNGWDASILIPGAHLFPADCPKDYKPSWFETDVPVFDDVRIIKSDDLVIIHEEGIWCYEHLIANNPRMVMLNQGLTSSLTDNVGMNITYDFAKQVYDRCEAVVTISPAITTGLMNIFGVDSMKLFTIPNPIDDFFTPGVKENTILVMNKQPGNIASIMLLKIILNRYPGWNVKLIQNMSLMQVADEMSRAKIFAFLCSPLGEGSSLPPVEAALSGCKVIGYSGVGSSYYFLEPIFTEIAYNDIDRFVRVLDEEVRLQEESNEDRFKIHRESLRINRSKERFTRVVGRVFGEIING